MRRLTGLAAFTAIVFLPLAAEEKLPTIDEAIARHIAARGGIEKLKAVKSMKITGKTVIGGGQMEALITVFNKRPNLTRVEMKTQGKTFIQAYDGVTAWAANPFTGSGEPQKSGEDETRAIASSGDLDGAFVDYKSKGNSVELVGKDDVEGTPAYKIKLTRKDGSVEYHWFDTEKYMPIKSSAKRKQMGNEMEIDSYPGNFKSVEGVVVPFTLEQKINGRTMVQMTMEKVEVNVPIDDAIFKLPIKEDKK